MPIAKQCRNSLPGHRDFGSPLFRMKKFTKMCLIDLFVLIYVQKSIFNLGVAEIESLDSDCCFHAILSQQCGKCVFNSCWNTKLLHFSKPKSLELPVDSMLHGFSNNATGRILVEKRPPDVPPQTPPHIIALVNRCVSQLKTELDMTGGVSFSFATRCPIGDPYQVFTLIFSNWKFGKMSWKRCFYAKKISWKCLVFDTRWCLTHRGESAPQSLGETDMQKQQRNFDEFDLRNCTRSWFACALVQQLWQEMRWFFHTNTWWVRRFEMKRSPPKL